MRKRNFYADWFYARPDGGLVIKSVSSRACGLCCQGSAGAQDGNKQMMNDVAVSSQIDTYVRGESAQTDSTSKAVFARSGYAAMQIRPGKPPAAPDKPKTKYKIAHIHEQGNDMIIVPVDALTQ